MTHRIHPDPFVIHPPLDMLEKLPELRRTASRLASMYVDGELGTLYAQGNLDLVEQRLQTMGRALWDALALPQADFDAAIAAAGEDILPVIIAGHTSAVQALPWETLFHPLHGFIGKHPKFTLSRQLSSTIAAQDLAATPLAKGPLRVLLFSSLPDDVDAETSRLNLEEEQAQLQEALLPWIAKGLVQLEIPDDGRFSTLQTMLKEFEPHLLFLSGHGRFHHEPHTGEAPYGVFGFESEIGKSEEVRQEDIARALMGTGVQAVVLSACESSKNTPASDALNHGLAQCISAQGIAYVIGMRESVFDVAGIAFARALCDALAGGERIDVALQAARIAMQARFTQEGLVATGAVELSDGQWCLPMLISSNPGNVLIDWHFQPMPIDHGQISKTTLGEVLLPERFIGRRKELRQYKNRLLKGELHHLLITAPGGQGKTALAGKLAMDMQQRGWQVFTWRARPENPWREFLLTEMQMLLSKPRTERYDRFCGADTNELERAKLLLELVMEQFDGRVILFLDNLESLQNPDTQALDDAVVAAWLTAAQETPGLILLATSRSRLPDWHGAYMTLEHANYGDFLQIAQRLALPDALFEDRELLRHVYAVLGGNCRGLEFFSAAIKTMDNAAEEQAFLDRLAQVKTDLQADMAIEAIVQHLRNNERALLQRLPVYAEAVPIEGIVKLGSDLPEPEALLQRLLAVSLVEAGYEARWKVMQYQCSPLVADWLEQQGLLDWAEMHLNAAADYHMHLFQHERDTLNQAIVANNALRSAGRDDEADRLTLDFIVGPMTKIGLYVSLLNNVLPRICNTVDEHTRAEALGQTGKIYLEIGNYKKALVAMKRALTIHQQSGDKAGEGTILNNIGGLYLAQGDYKIALGFLEEARIIQQQIEDNVGQGFTLINIAQTYHAQGENEIALDYLKQALALHQQIGHTSEEGTIFNNIGGIYESQGNYEMALNYLKQSLNHSQKIGHIVAEGTTINNIALVYDARGDYETALAYLKQSLILCQEIGDKKGEGTTLNNISQIFKGQGDYRLALEHLKKSQEISQQIGDKEGEGTGLNNISQIHHAQGDLEAALTCLIQALSIWRQIAHKAGEGATLGNISEVYCIFGDYEKALDYVEQSLIIYQQIGNKAGECTALNNIGQIYRSQSDYETAIDFLNRALSLYREIGDKVGEGSALNNIASIFHTHADYETALIYLKQALAIQKETGNTAGEGISLNNISQIFKIQGDYESALIYMQQALSISQQIGNKADEATVLNNISQIYHAQGDVETALNFLKQTLIVWRQIGHKAGEGAALNNLAETYRTYGDYNMALLYLKQSLVILQQIGDQAGECTVLNNIGQIYRNQSDYATALDYLEEALTIYRQIGDKAGESTVLNNISAIHIASGSYEPAISNLKQALATHQQIGNKAGEGVTLNNISQILKAQGDYESALRYMKEALAISQQMGNKADEGAALNNISQIYRAKGDDKTTLNYLKQALIIWEQIGHKAGEGSTLNNISQIYHSQGDYKSALNCLKRALSIQQQIGDKAGLCVTMLNIGHIYFNENQANLAVGTWTTMYTIAKQNNLTQVLQELADLAPHLGLPAGLNGWEQLAQQSQSRVWSESSVWGKANAANDPQA